MSKYIKSNEVKSHQFSECDCDKFSIQLVNVAISYNKITWHDAMEGKNIKNILIRE